MDPLAYEDGTYRGINTPHVPSPVILHPHAHEDGTIEVSETSALKPQTPGKYPKENILHKEHAESFKSRHFQRVIYMAACATTEVFHVSALCTHACYCEVLSLILKCPYVFVIQHFQVSAAGTFI